MGSQLLQNTQIIKQTGVVLWKIWRKYVSVSYSFGCMLCAFYVIFGQFFANHLLEQCSKLNHWLNANLKFKYQMDSIVRANKNPEMFFFQSTCTCRQWRRGAIIWIITFPTMPRKPRISAMKTWQGYVSQLT